jgi:putative cardiolipin synthase
VLLSQLGGSGPALVRPDGVSPYFVPGKEGTERLVATARGGARVRVVTNSLASTDVGAVHAGYKKSRRELLEGGVELFEMMPRLDAAAVKSSGFSFSGSSGASLHAKMFVIDRQKVFIGSMNLDPRSVQINTEIGLLIDSPGRLRIAYRVQSSIGEACYSVVLEPRDAGNPSGKTELAWIEDRGGEKVRYDKEPQTTFWQRFGVGFIGLLPVDSQL